MSRVHSISLRGSGDLSIGAGLLALCVVTISLFSSNVKADEMSQAEFDAIVQERIVGGKNAEIDSYPSTVAIVAAPDGVNTLFDRQFCGGTVISERMIVTAAHCVVSERGVPVPSDYIRVVSGTASLRENAAIEELVVSNIFPHPSYQQSDSSVTDDIALIELANPIDVPPASLFTGNPEDYSGKMSSIVGWGAVAEQDGNLLFTYDLQHADVPLVARSICNQQRSYNGTISDRQFCAGYQEGGVDSCSGDSGGPLFIDVNGEKILAGLTSYGNGCAQANYYGVYTSVSSYVPWIAGYSTVTTGNELLAAVDSSATDSENTPASNETLVRSVDSGGGAGGPVLMALLSLLVGVRRSSSLLKTRRAPPETVRIPRRP